MQGAWGGRGARQFGRVGGQIIYAVKWSLRRLVPSWDRGWGWKPQEHWKADGGDSESGGISRPIKCHLHNLGLGPGLLGGERSCLPVLLQTQNQDDMKASEGRRKESGEERGKERGLNSSAVPDCPPPPAGGPFLGAGAFARALAADLVGAASLTQAPG